MDGLSTTLDALTTARILLWAGLGVLVWAVGRQAARVCWGLGGLALGGMAVLLWSQPLQEAIAAPMWVLLGVGSAGAGLLAWAMFRVGVGVICAGLLGVVVPLGLMAWQEPAMPFFHPQMAIDPVMDDPARDGAGWDGPPWESAAWDDGAWDGTTAWDATAWDRQDDRGWGDQEKEDEPASLEGRFARRLGHTAGQWSAWFEQQTTARKVELYLTAAVAGLCGLVGGLVRPLWGASLITAMVGSLVMWSCIQVFVGVWVNEAPWWVSGLDPRSMSIHLGLLTLLGVAVQSVVLRSSTDNA